MNNVTTYLQKPIIKVSFLTKIIMVLAVKDLIKLVRLFKSLLILMVEGSVRDYWNIEEIL